MNRWQALLITVTELRFCGGFCDLLMSCRLLLGAPFESSDLNFVCCECAQAVKELSLWWRFRLVGPRNLVDSY
jgi:hypothetical protein